MNPEVETGDASPNGQHEDTEQDLAKGAELDAFLLQNNITTSKKKRRNLLALSTQAYEAYKLGVVVATSCRTMDLDRAYEAYLAAKSAGVVPLQDTLYNLLNLTAGLGDQGSSLAPPRTVEPPQNIAAAQVVFADMRVANIKMGESSLTAMIRCCSMNGQEDQALALYRELQALELQPKLRTYCSMLAAFARQSRDVECFALFGDLTQRYGLVPTEREYLSMLRLLSQLRDDRFYAMLDSMMEDVLVPSEEGWAVLREWFQGCPSQGFECCEVEADDCGRLAVSTARAAQGSAIVTQGGSSSSPHGQISLVLQLRSVDLDDVTKEALLQQIESLASARAGNCNNSLPVGSSGTGGPGDPSSSEGAGVNPRAVGGGNGRGSTAEKAPGQGQGQGQGTEIASKWDIFKAWIAPRVPGTSTTAGGGAGARIGTRPFDVVVDGANCGYYKQNYAGAPSHVDYRQIDWMVRQLQARGMHPLLVLHSRHTANVHSLPAEFAPIVQAWRRDELLYETPPRCNDDWFWLYTAVALGCRVVTNDEMRDHHFQMLSPRSFQRWKERRQVRFTFGVWLYESEANAQAKTQGRFQEPVPVPVPVPGSQPDPASAPASASASTSASASGSASARTSTVLALAEPQRRPETPGMIRQALLSIPRSYSHRMQCLVPRLVYAFPCEGKGDVWLAAISKSWAVAEAEAEARAGTGEERGDDEGDAKQAQEQEQAAKKQKRA